MRTGFEQFYKTHLKEEYKNAVIVDAYESGAKLEKYVEGILSMSDMSLTHTAPKYDVCFGADYLVSYIENNINHSFYMDVTFNKAKNIEYLKLDGTLTNMYHSASIQFGFGNVAFGLKRHHGSRFKYEKPVVVAVFSNVYFDKSVNITDTEVRIIESILKSLNALLIKQGCNKRASKVIYPNPNRY